jgi:hypothetical protein
VDPLTGAGCVSWIDKLRYVVYYTRAVTVLGSPTAELQFRQSGQTVFSHRMHPGISAQGVRYFELEIGADVLGGLENASKNAATIPRFAIRVGNSHATRAGNQVDVCGSFRYCTEQLPSFAIQRVAAERVVGGRAQPTSTFHIKETAVFQVKYTVTYPTGACYLVGPEGTITIEQRGQVVVTADLDAQRTVRETTCPGASNFTRAVPPWLGCSCC